MDASPVRKNSTSLFKYRGNPQAREKKNVKDENQDTRNTWRASVAFCVRAALVHAHMIDGYRLSIPISPTRIAQLVRQNRERLDISTAKPVNSEASSGIDASSSASVLASSFSNALATLRFKKCRMDWDEKSGDGVGDKISLATTPAPRMNPAVSSVSRIDSSNYPSNNWSDVPVCSVSQEGS